VEAPLDRAERERRIVLAARQPFLLHRGDGDAVDEEGRGRIVVVRRDAQDSHQYWLRRGRSSCGTKPFGSRRAERLAMSANGGVMTKYWTRTSSPPSRPAMRRAMRKEGLHTPPARRPPPAKPPAATPPDP